MTAAEAVPPALAGERIDRVVTLVTGCSRSRAATLIDDGRVRVNGVPAASRSLRVAHGDEIEVDEPTAAAPSVVAPDPSVDVTVVHADDDVIVVDKAPGVVVHPGAGNRDGTLVAGLLARFPELARIGDDPDRPGIVHRLDKDTSGLLVVARTPRAYASLRLQLAARTARRQYLALVWDAFDAPSGMVEGALGRARGDRTRMAVTAGGREARTTYEVRRAYTRPVGVTLLACGLETGRTHQIRVHLSAIGHPVVGDARYGGARRSFPVPRLFLHAASLAFEHPATGLVVTFTSALPPDLAGVLDRLS